MELAMDFVRWNTGSDMARDVRDFLDNENAQRKRYVVNQSFAIGTFMRTNGTLKHSIHTRCNNRYTGRSEESESTNRRRLDRFIVTLTRFVDRVCLSVYP